MSEKLSVVVRTEQGHILTSSNIHQLTQSLHRFQLRLALATSFAASWIHLYSQSTSSCNRIKASDFGSDIKVATRRSTSALLSSSSSTIINSKTSSRRLSRNVRHFRTYSSPNRQETVEAQQTTIQKQQELEKPPSSEGVQARELTDITDIGTLMRHPALLDNIKKPRYPIVLCHGLYGFDVRGPFWGLEIHYWASVLDILRKKVGAEVIVRGVPGTGAIAHRAKELHKFLSSSESGIRGRPINFVAHSMGGLDARHIISVIKPKPEDYTPVSLTTICTPHKGSPFMDWCNANVGTGNDRVEAEIREAKKRLGGKGAKADQLEQATDAAEEEQRKLPFSLKSPLFVRPSKQKSSQAEEYEGMGNSKDDESKLERLKSTVTEVVSKTTSIGTTPPSSLVKSEEEIKSSSKGIDKKDSSSSSSLLNFSSFNKAIAKIGGSFSAYILEVLDQPAYAMLSTRYMSQVFNPSVPNSPEVAYFSVASRKRSLPIYHPLWLPKLILDAAAESRSAGGERDGSGDALGSNLQGNDGLVSVESAKWGTFLGVIEGSDHWDLRGGGAPRWRGRLNPATGKPWPKESNKQQQEEEKKEDKSWIDVNTILGRLLNRNKEADQKKNTTTTTTTNNTAKDKIVEKKKQDDKEEISTVKNDGNNTDEKSKQDDQGLIDEVATWISDRLPQGDEARRAQAEKVADEQEGKLQMYPNDSKLEQQASESSTSTESQQIESKSEKEKSFDSTSTSVKLRREAVWQEVRHKETARKLRRELAWHRSEWDREVATKGKDESSVKSSPSFSRELDWDRPTKQKLDKKDKAKPEDVNELERFWIAICLHLWSQGY